MRNAGDFAKVTAQAFEADADFSMREYAAGRLGLVQGFSQERFGQRFGRDLPDGIRQWFEKLADRGWARLDEATCVLTEAGRFHYREILREG